MTDQTMSDAVTRLLCRQVIPRLVSDIPKQNSGQADSAGIFDVRQLPDHADKHAADTYLNEVEQHLLYALRHGADHEAQHILAGAQSAGLSFDAMLAYFLPSVVRTAGDFWLADQMSFSEVTLVTHRLSHWLFNHAQAEQISPLAVSSALANSQANSQVSTQVSASQPMCVLWSPPGEQHVFGVEVFGLMLRRQGWRTVMRQGADLQRVMRDLRSRQFAFCGLSVGNMRAPKLIRGWVAQVREAIADNPTEILLGGAAVFGGHLTAASVGADFASGDGQASLAYAARLLGRTAQGDCSRGSLISVGSKPGRMSMG